KEEEAFPLQSLIVLFILVRSRFILVIRITFIRLFGAIIFFLFFFLFLFLLFFIFFPVFLLFVFGIFFWLTFVSFFFLFAFFFSFLCLLIFRLAFLGLLLFSFRFLCFAHYFCFFPLFSRSFPLSVVPYFALFLSVVFLVTVVRYSFSLAFLFYRYYDCCPIDDYYFVHPKFRYSSVRKEEKNYPPVLYRVMFY